MSDEQSKTVKRLPVWMSQIMAYLTGVGGLAADYGFEVFGPEHFHWAIYMTIIAFGLGIDPAALFSFMKGPGK